MTKVRRDERSKGNIGNWDLNVLLQRMQQHKVLLWSRLGRFKRTRMPNISGGKSRSSNFTM